MKYATVLELSLEHGCYADQQCRGLAIEPTAETTRLLDAHRCLVRTTPSRFCVITSLGGAGPLLPLPASASLRLELRIASADFALLTDLSEIHRTPSPMFSNAHMAADQTGALALVTRTTRDPSTGAIVPARQPPGVMAEIEIVLHPGGTIGRALPAATFEITFQPRQWRWAYYCITDLAMGSGALSIVDASSSGGAAALVFSDADRTELADHPDPTDPIAMQIAAGHPDLRCVRFLSAQAIACSDQPRASLELRLDGERVSSPLPNPSPRHFSRRELPAPASPEELLFQIIEYRVQPFPHS